MNRGRYSLLTILIVFVLFAFLFSILKKNRLEPIRVVILNASGDKSLNNFFSEYLKMNYVDVIYTANIPEEKIRTVVVDRYSNRCEYAKKIARYLKIKTYIPIIDTTYTEQVIVILGDDVKNLKILKRRRNWEE